MNNDFEKNDINKESQYSLGGDGNDNIESNKDIQEGKEENTEIGETQAEGSGVEEKTDGEEAQAHIVEETGAGEEGALDAEEASDTQTENGRGNEGVSDKSTDGHAKYSTSYAPPYYVPNFTVVGKENDTNTKKEKKKYGLGAVAAICAVCTVLAACFGAFAGYILDNKIFSRLGLSEDPLTILQGNKDVVVTEVPEGATYSGLSVAQVAALVGESVVEITTTHVQTNSFYGQYVTAGAGSGVIFLQDNIYGYIVTNYHVIEGADEVSVRAKNGDSYTTYKAEYIGGADAEDIAVIKIRKVDCESFVVAQFGDSDKLSVGEEVVAIGNPLGQLGGTVTNGIISALDRQITVEDNVMTLLQTNAAINPGNSGGGLFDTSGMLIGIVNAKQSSSGIEGLGFAIPSNNVLKDVTDIMNLGYVSGRPTLGITVQEATYWNQTLVRVVQASNTLFKQYDCIVMIGDTDILSLNDYNKALNALKIGDSVKVVVYRDSGYVTLNVTVTENKSTS